MWLATVHLHFDSNTLADQTPGPSCQQKKDSKLEHTDDTVGHNPGAFTGALC